MQTTDNLTPQEMARDLAYGRTLTFRLPSGYEVTIREQNGNDDDILSNNVTSKDMSNFNIFIASLVVNTNLPFAVNGKLNSELARKLLLRDKYYILIRSRIHSIGNELKITYDWGKEFGGEVEYIEDLNRYIWDYENPFPTKGEEGYDIEKVEPYIIPGPYDVQEIVLESGRKLRFNLFNGDSEALMLKVPLEQLSNNSEIKARNLEQFIEGQWVKVENFVSFKSREMIEMKKYIRIADPAFRAMTDLENPTNGDVQRFPILSSVDFFYPEEI